MPTLRWRGAQLGKSGILDKTGDFSFGKMSCLGKRRKNKCGSKVF
jgi:hypothetical protein